WGGDERAQLTQEVIDLFMDANPNIRIEGEPRPGDAYWDVLAVQLEGGAAPDILQFGGNYPDFTNHLQPLQGFVADGTINVGSAPLFDQAVLEVGTLGGNLYGICLGTNFLTLAYNRTILEAAGAPLPPNDWTWDQFIDYGKQIAPLLPSGVFPFVDNSVNQANYIAYFFEQRGESLWTAEEKTFATVDGALAWVNLWEDMRDLGLIPDMETSSSFGETGVDNSALVAGRAVFGLLWSNQVNTYQGAMTDELGIAHLPVASRNALVIQVSQYLSVNVASQYPEAAAAFINFFVTDPEAGAILGTDRGIPSSPVVRDSVAPLAGPIERMLYEYLSIAAPRTVPQGPNLPNDREFVDSLRLIGESVGFGVMTRQEAAEDIYDLIQFLIAR
ncbi:MAG: extracellular solute-binding protein, partial [Oscillospiraceae bacterium]|nr:extracellular solute-binding protein [Oscillospiraceae bacterium]